MSSRRKEEPRVYVPPHLRKNGGSSNDLQSKTTQYRQVESPSKSANEEVKDKLQSTTVASPNPSPSKNELKKVDTPTRVAISLSSLSLESPKNTLAMEDNSGKKDCKIENSNDIPSALQSDSDMKPNIENIEAVKEKDTAVESSVSSVDDRATLSTSTEDLDEWELQLEDGKLDETLNSMKSKEAPKPVAVNNRKVVKGRGNLKYNNESSFDATEMEDEDDQRSTPKKNTSKVEDQRKTTFSIQDTASDSVTEKDSLDADTDHVLEIVGFPSTTTTKDIDSFLDSYKSFGYRVQWVDEGHCLAIFRSPVFARDALAKLQHPNFKLIEFSKACEASKAKYYKKEGLDYLMPSSGIPRPKTTATVARRLISNALQMPELQMTPEHKQDEKMLQQQRREKRLQKEEDQKKKSYWND